MKPNSNQRPPGPLLSNIEEQKAIHLDPDRETLALINEKSSEMDHDAIKDVWLSNFFESMEQVASLVDEYNYISMVSRSLIGSTQCLWLYIGHRIPRNCIFASRYGQRKSPFQFSLTLAFAFIGIRISDHKGQLRSFKAHPSGYLFDKRVW